MANYGLERIPLAVDSDFQLSPVRANLPDQSKEEIKLIDFTPDQQQAAPTDQKQLGGMDTLSLLGRNIWDAVVYHTPAAVAAAIEGDDPYKDQDWKDSLIERSRKRSQEMSAMGDDKTSTAIPFASKQDINSLGPSLGFSVVGAGAGLGAGIPAGIAGNMVAPVAGTAAGYTAGMAASGKSAYNMATNQFVRDLYDSVNQESIKATGKPITPDQFSAKQAELSDVIRSYGLWEAVPEAAGNALSFGVLTAPVKGAIGKLFGKNVATRFATKLGSLYGGELSTETITQMGQHNAEVDAGMSQDPKREFTNIDDWVTSFKEVAPSTILQTTLMAGGFKAGQMAKERIFNKKGDDKNPDDAIPAGDIGAGPGGGGSTGEFIPADPRQGLPNLPQDGQTYDQTDYPQLPPPAGPIEGDYLGREAIDGPGSSLEPSRGPTYSPIYPGIEGRQQPDMFARPGLPSPEEGGPTERQIATARGILNHSPRATPETLSRLMGLHPYVSQMLYNHWQSTEGTNNAQGTQAVQSQPALQELPQAAPETGGVPGELTVANQQTGMSVEFAGQKYAVESIEDAVAKWNRFQETTGGGVSEIGNGVPIFMDGKQVARISYNGRVWDNADNEIKLGAGRTALDTAAHTAATSPLNDLPQPTEAQKEAGNYQKGHVTLHGLDIAIENPAGSERSGTAPDGKKWSVTMQHHYGYLKGTVGKDKDHVDVFLTKQAEQAKSAWIVDQIDPKTGKLDEHKVVIGPATEAEARQAYLDNYEKGWSGLGAITEMPMADFKTWAMNGKRKTAAVGDIRQGQYDAAKARGDNAEMRRLAHEINQAKHKQDAKAQPDEKNSPEEGKNPYGRVGSNPLVTQDVSLKDNGDGTSTVMRGDEPFYDFDSGDPITVKNGSTPQQVQKTVEDANAITTRERFYGVQEADAANPASEVNQEDTIAEKAVADMSEEQLQKIADGKTASEEAKGKAKKELAGRKKKDKAPTRYRFIRRGSGNESTIEAITEFKDVKIPGLEGEKAFAHTGENGVTNITHAETGMIFAKGVTTPAALREAGRIVKARGSKNIMEVIGKSPVISIDEMNTAIAAYEQAVKDEAAAKEQASEAEKEHRKQKEAIETATKDAFTAMAGDQSIANAAANSPDNFNIEAVKQVKDWISKQMAEEKDPARLKALDSLLKDGKPTLPESFYEGLLKEIKQQAKEKQLAGLKEASQQTLLNEMATLGISSDSDRKMFAEGWNHALTGKTKSTLPNGDTYLAGYTSGRGWMQTDAGKNTASGKRQKKLENTGADLKRWFDKQKQAITSDDTETVINQLDAATSRAELFKSVITESSTPGATRWLEGFRSRILPFKEWLVEKGPLARNVYGRYVSRRSGPTDEIRLYLDGERYIAENEDEAKADRINRLKLAADEYVALVSQVVEGLDGSNVKALANSLESLFIKEGTTISAWASALSEKGNELAVLLRDKYRDLNKYGVADSYTNRDLIKNESQTIESTRKASLTPPRLDRVDRNGEDFRKGKNVTPQEFKKRFNFADVGFGKWVGAKQDQDHLNYAYDAFRDLAKLIGIPDEAISLDGQLHFTIGALGHGKFAAHYQQQQPHPDGGTVPVINVTNTRGDGTVAHEWAHALDLTPREGRAALAAAIHEIKNDLQYAYNMDGLRSSVMSFLRGGSYWTGDKRARKTDEGKIDGAIKAIDYYTVPSRQQSEYYKEAIKLDGPAANKKPYWSNDKELFARAFEAWVGDALETDNTYLVNPGWSGEGAVTGKTHRGTPYPVGEERKRFAEWFDALRKSMVFKDGKLMLDSEKWQANKPNVREEWNKALEDLKASLPAMLESLKRETAAKKVAFEDAVAHARTMRVGDLVKVREGEHQSIAELFAGQPAAIIEVIQHAEGNGTGPSIVVVDKMGNRRRYYGSYFEVVERYQTPTPQEVEQVQAEAQPTGQLSDDELGKLFDEAAAELQESKQEQPEAPAAGEPVSKMADAWTAEDKQFLLDKVNAGKMILLSGEPWAKENGIPTIHDVSSLMGNAEVNHVGFGMFKVTGNGFDASFDGGGEMSHTPGGHAYTVLSMSRGEFKNYPFDRVKRALGNVTKQEKQSYKAEKTLDEQTDKTASAILKEAAKLGVKGVDESLKGLLKLFGGGPGKLMSFPAGMDKESYEAAKPHFKAALKAFQDAGKSIKEFFKFLIENFGAGIKPYAIYFAKEEGLTMELGNKPSAYRQIAQEVRQALELRRELPWQYLFQIADKAFGGTQAEGKYDVKSAYDAMEMGVNLYLMDKKIKGDAPVEAATSMASRLHDLIQILPTQTKRTAEQDEFQQFSTPPALAYVASWVANINERDVLMEPSAGTGDLAIYAYNKGAALILNELSSRRAAILKELFPSARIFTENAEQLNNVLPADAIPTVVVMNPPFSATAGRVEGKRDTMNGAKHIEQALKRLPEGGRLVAIVGEGMAHDRPAFKDWWKRIQSQYNVRANIGISGKEYAKYGTTFDNQILVIDKNGSTINSVVTGKVESVSELPALLEGIRNDRPAVTERLAIEPESGKAVEIGRADAAQADATGRSATDAVGNGSGRNQAGRGNADGRLSESGNAADGNAAANNDGVSDQDGQRGRVSNRPGRDGTGRGRGDTAAGIDTGDAVATGEAGGVTVGQAEKQKPAGELTDSVFEQYRPQRLDVPGAKEHPGKLVQSSAMASVEPPAPGYTPNLPKEVITKGLLSLAQIESVVYAGQAHSQMLPNGERRGFFIGDGTGVGKGREISGIILDNMRQGRQKALWISFNEGLLNDAQRDFKGVGGDPKLLFFQGKIKPANQITAKHGILFTSYSTLKSGEKKQANDKGQKAGRSRLDQIVEWVGEDFDGVIVFDEAHSMGNVVEMKGKRGKKKPSQQAIAGVNLQKRLPKARIVYVSATGATEISNLGYGSRLGLWGENTAFSDVKDFIGKISEGGVAAMELISRDMKAMGMYIARSLSFDGVTYQRLDHDLTDLQTDIYNELAKAWQGVLQNVEAALKLTDGAKNGGAKSAAMSAFWGAHQRFFNQVITSLQTPTVIEDMQKQIAAGNAVVIQLVNTNEATQEREVAKAQADGVELEELDFTPRQMLMDYVRNSFPVQAYEEATDDDGNTIYKPVMDSNGNPVFDKEAIAMRDKLLENLEQIRVPENPLDAIIQAFGSEKVGEVTGRKRRFVQVRDENGDLKVVEEKRGKHASHNDAVAFQDDKKPILIFSQAGGTGYSFHADNTAKNQRKRIHYILQPGWRADSAVQGFGRTHRTNQASEPHYVLPTTNLKAQKRFVSSIARRLDQLGALTRGQRQATSQGLFTASDNLESKYASDALDVFFQDMYRGETSLDFNEISKAMGFDNLVDKKTGGLNTSSLPEIPQFLNRLLSLQSNQQDQVFSEFEKRLEEVVNFAIQQGTYDNGLQTLKADSIVKVRDEVAFTDQRTGAETRYVEVDVTNPVKYRSWEKAKEHVTAYQKQFDGWYKDAKSGKVFGLIDLGQRVNSKGETVNRGAIFDIRDGRQRYIDNVDEIKVGKRWNHNSRSYEVFVLKIDEATAEAAWNAQVEAAPKQETKREHLIVGVILPIWDRVKGHPRIYRLQTDEGERMIGRIIGPKDVQQTLKNLGLGSTASKMTPPQIIDQIRKGAKAILANGWEISTSTVSGEKRIEITKAGGFLGGDKSVMLDQGVFFERIQWQDRAFIPAGEDGIAVLSRVTASKPVVELIGVKGMESRANYTREAFAANFMQELAASEPEVFRYPTTVASTVQGALHDVFPGVTFLGDHVSEEDKAERKAEHRYVFQLPGEGKQFDVYVGGNKVWLNISRSLPGMQGSRVYSALADYAFNTRQKFIGDPEGVSADAINARNKMMLASVLKHGVTRHVEASREQVKGIEDSGIEPLDWRGSDVEKLRSLIHTVVKTMQNRAPAIKDYYYDFNTRSFSKLGKHDAGTADVLSDLASNDDDRAFAAITSAVGESQRRAAGLGAASGRAGIIIQSLISAEGRGIGDGGILQAVLDFSRALIDGGLRGILSKTTPANAGVSASAAKVSDVQAVVDKFKSMFKGAAALKIKVVANTAEIPAAFRPSQYAEGVFHDDVGIIYLVAGNIPSKSRAFQVLMHEAVGHFGLAQMMGDRFSGILKQVMQVAKAKGRVADDIYEPGHPDYATVEAVKLRYPDASDAEVAQEVMARMAESDSARTLFGYIRAVVRQWLRDMARAFGVDLDVSTAELNDMVALASGYMRRGDNMGQNASPTGMAAASKGRIIKQSNVDRQVVLGDKHIAWITKTANGWRVEVKGSDFPMEYRTFAEAKDYAQKFVEIEQRFGNESRAEPQKLSDDLQQQTRYLNDEAAKRGFDDVTLFAANDFDGFMAAAEQWRSDHPAPSGLESRASAVKRPKVASRGILDPILRKLGGEAAAKITGPAFDKLVAFVGGKMPEGIKAGLVSDYGLEEPYLDRRTGMQTEQQRGARKVKSFIDRLADLDRAQSRVAYQWLNNRGAEADRLLKELPEESRKVLEEIKREIARLTEEAVRLGQLDEETAARNAMAYLHRSYAKYDLNTDDKTWKAERAKAIKILGDQYKGRGLKMDVDPDRIHAVKGWWAGEMKGKKVKVLKNENGRYAFVAAGTPVPAQFSGYTQEGVWEIRSAKAANKITLWRDFTEEERQMMGELDEAKYAVARTLFMMQRDIEIGRFHEWVAEEYAKTPEEADEEGLNIVDASESLMHAFKSDDWVTVPTAKIPGTGVFKYGAMAGMVVPGPIWNDIRQISAGRGSPLKEAWRTILRSWKLSKTALTPTTHVNNIMGNFVMADFHDVGARDVLSAVRVMLAAAKGDKDAQTLLNRFEDSGATQGMFTTHELKKEVLDPLMKALREEVGMADDEAAILKVGAIMSLAFHGKIGEAASASLAAIKQSMPGRATATVLQKAQDYYQNEDAIFRLAAFIKGVEEGVSDLEAGKAARAAFLDYHINAPWINAARGSVLPFIAFAYRAVPMMLQTAAHKPWKIAKLMLVFGGLNALAYAMLGDDGDEDKERAYLPEEKSGKVWGIVPKLVRMPWNREGVDRAGRAYSDPVFLDVRRWVPVGDIVDFGQDKTALPIIPPPLVPGGPLVLAGEFFANHSLFTGKDITLETDTMAEKTAKVMEHFYKGMAPNVPLLPGTWATKKITDAAKGKTDPIGRAYDVPSAVLSGVGVKLSPYPTDGLKVNAAIDLRGKLAELDKQARALRRDYGRGGLDSVELKDKLDVIYEKKRKAAEEFKEKSSRAGR